MKSLRLLVALSALVPAVASAASVYNIWANKPGTLTTLGATQIPTSVDTSVSWNTNTQFAFAFARAKTSAGETYEFQLVSVTSVLPTDRVYGTWNVTRNGIALCSQCAGYVAGLSSGAGKPLTISVDGGNYQVSPIMTSRYDIW
ncbi:hypothetical protein [Archangium sp.]|jgi:hypothetical protein|uniref:hypothetical protein n=1 Tax=Archangium sp. TaxID=1872627 RepID=UPI002EDA3738